MRWNALVVLWLAATFAIGQESGPPVPQEGALRAQFRREGERLHDACTTFNFSNGEECAILLFTDHPLHIAAGSIAPQDGFGIGGAFVTSRNTTNWRMSWDVDAVVSTNLSWRTGGYMKMIHTPREKIGVVMPAVSQPGEAPGATPARKPRINLVHPYTVFNLYAQSTSLNRLNFFGLGNDSALSGKSVFGMTEIIVGANVIKPVFEWPATSKLNLALLGEVNGRFVNLRGNHAESAPSIETLYTDATAPGLNHQPGFIQLGEGVRIKPVIGDYFQLNYMAKFQQFFAPSSSQNSFLRWTADLDHTFFLYGYTQSAPKNTDGNGPDECGPLTAKCPPVSRSRNLNGSVGVRLLLSESITSGTSAVPFYFQPTLGGGDLNGAPALSSYQDYRFRAPNILLLQEKFEHSIWGPLGVTFMADQGKVALTRGDIGFSHLKHSFGTGLTLRAGGFPMVFLMFAWGGNEGHHTIANMNTSLLGGSSRPTLY